MPIVERIREGIGGRGRLSRSDEGIDPHLVPAARRLRIARRWHFTRAAGWHDSAADRRADRRISRDQLDRLHTARGSFVHRSDRTRLADVAIDAAHAADRLGLPPQRLIRCSADGDGPRRLLGGQVRERPGEQTPRCERTAEKETNPSLCQTNSRGCSWVLPA